MSGRPGDPTREIKGTNWPDPLELDRAAVLAKVKGAESTLRLLRYLDAARLAGGLQPARHVDGVAPQIVAEFVLADHAGHHASGVDADAQIEVLLALASQALGEFDHLDGKVGDGGGMVLSCRRDTRGDHVGVADCL